MSNQDNGCVVFLPDLNHQLQDLGLNCYIKGGCGFIGNEDFRLTGQGH